MIALQYNRKKAAEYAARWALSRNPSYYSFNGIGGDCTNFVSQCIYAGAGVMNYTPEFGWFYRSTNDRTASWTGVEFLYDFLIQNHSVGPFGRECELADVRQGDVIQLGSWDDSFYHTLFVMQGYPQVRVSAHSQDALNRSLTSYTYETMRCVHIEPVRHW